LLPEPSNQSSQDGSRNTIFEVTLIGETIRSLTKNALLFHLKRAFICMDGTEGAGLAACMAEGMAEDIQKAKLREMEG
jgi:hypothetical protein